MIPVKVDQLFLSNMGFAVLLRGEDDERVLPIMIGASEAQSIALCINEVEVPRPLTHDLLKSVIEEMGATLTRMEVCDLKNGTFFARLILEHRGGEMEVDSRPSDAIALALRFGAPIFVSESVMNDAGRIIGAEEMSSGVAGAAKAAATGKPKPPSKGRKPTRLESLRAQMQKAIEEERYEDCARLRDEIAGIEGLEDRRH